MKNLKQNSKKNFAKEFILKYPKFSSVNYSKENLVELTELIKTEVLSKLNKLSARWELRECVETGHMNKEFTGEGSKRKLASELVSLPFKDYPSSVVINSRLISVLGKIIYDAKCYRIQVNKIYFEETDNAGYALGLIDTLAHEVTHGFVYSRFRNPKHYSREASQVHANDGHPFFEKCLEIVGASSTRTETNLKIYHTFQCEHTGCANRLSYFRKATKTANSYLCSIHDKNFTYIGRYDYTTLEQANTHNIRL